MGRGRGNRGTGFAVDILRRACTESRGRGCDRMEYNMNWHRSRNSRWDRNDPLAADRMRRLFGDEESLDPPRPQRIDSVDDLLEPLTLDDLEPPRELRPAKLPRSRRLDIPPPITGITVDRRITFHRGPSGGAAAVAALSGSLFLLACAYAAFSGYMHS